MHNHDVSTYSVSLEQFDILATIQDGEKPALKGAGMVGAVNVSYPEPMMLNVKTNTNPKPKFVFSTGYNVKCHVFTFTRSVRT